MAALSSAELLEQLTRTLGPDAASALMDRLPPEGSRVATRDDLLALREVLEARFEGLESRFEARFEASDARLEGLEDRFEARFGQLEAKIGEAKYEILAATRGELIAAVTSQTRTMIVTMVGAVVSMMGFVVAFERLVP